MACINVNHPEYKELVSKLNQYGITNTVRIQATIMEFQEENETDLFPDYNYFVSKFPNKQKDGEIQNKNELSKVSTVQDTRVKEGVDSVFETNPELAKIGTREQYSQYLDSIFPNSNIKEIYLHQTNNDFKNEGFDKSKIGSNTNNNGYYGYGFYFVKDTGTPIDGGWGGFDSAPIAYGEIEMPVVLNVKKIKNDITTIQKNPKKVTDDLKKEGYDSINAPDGLIVFEPEQIHILSNKKDLEMFRNFINFTKSEYAKYGDIQQFKDYIMSKNFAAIEEFLVVNNKIDRKC